MDEAVLKEALEISNFGKDPPVEMLFIEIRRLVYYFIELSLQLVVHRSSLIMTRRGTYLTSLLQS